MTEKDQVLANRIILLDSQRIQPLIERSPTILAEVKSELLAFADFLNHLS